MVHFHLSFCLFYRGFGYLSVGQTERPCGKLAELPKLGDQFTSLNQQTTFYTEKSGVESPNKPTGYFKLEIQTLSSEFITLNIAIPPICLNDE